MKPALKFYVGTVVLAGLLTLVYDCYLWASQGFTLVELMEESIWILLLLGISHFHITSKDGSSVSTLNSALNYCLILSFGPAFAGPAVALSSFYLNSFRRGVPWFKSLFNIAQVVLAVNLAGGLYILGGGTVGVLLDFHNPLVIPQLLLPFLGFTFTNLLLVAIVIWLDTGITFRQQIRRNHYYEIWGAFILFYLGALLSYLYMQFNWMGVLLSVVPLAWVYMYLKRYNELSNTHTQLEDKQKELEIQSLELKESNRALEGLNTELADNQNRLNAKTFELEQVNQSLKELNADLKQTRSSLVQSEKLKAMGQMAGGVAHDFNNILGAIIGRTELMQLDELPDSAMESLRLIHRSAMDGAAVVRRIQDFSRVTQERNFEAVDCSELMADVLEMTRPIWKDKANRLGHTYRVELLGKEAVWVDGNPSELREVLHNMVSNALDAMPSGGCLDLECSIEAEQAVLTVADSGHGMTEEVLDRLFDPFFSTKGKRGNGLGLSVSFGIIERHGGEISVVSKPEEGSQFRITLPLRKAGAPGPGEGIQGKAVSLSGLRSRRVLVVDDEEDVREVLCDVLRTMGHEVTGASSGGEGLDIYGREKQDLVFTDLGMPHMNGWEFAGQVRLMRDSEGNQPQIILVTGWSAQVKQEDLEKHKVDRVLSKPFKLKQLKDILEELDAGKDSPT